MHYNGSLITGQQRADVFRPGRNGYPETLWWWHHERRQPAKKTRRTNCHRLLLWQSGPWRRHLVGWRQTTGGLASIAAESWSREIKWPCSFAWLRNMALRGAVSVYGCSNRPACRSSVSTGPNSHSILRWNRIQTSCC